VVNLATSSCDYADAESRDPNSGYKHIRRARLATSREAVPATVTVDDQLAEHVATPVTDGGVVPEAESDHAEIVDDGDTWSGPHTEYNRYGEPTGHEYVRCNSCGVEIVAGRERDATHRTDCRHAE